LDIKDKVASIIGNASTIENKAKAIYDWICDNIVYDTTKQIFDAETCWKTGRGVCQAYSELFCYMAESVGLVVDIIVGKTQNPEGEILESKHAWVFVYTHAYDGIFIDPTWGAGFVDGSRFVKSDDNSPWFNVSPYWMIFSHFPDKEYWAKLDIKITEDQFKNLPYLLPEKGIDGKDALFEGISKIQ
jgi:transglutaminase/protease-like cytokinesis protein 3